ncbi:HBR166Cp [Eremothecium sinecaudum]|uniref:Small ribosomal subunit protein mS37 n=1 Tax=Eremothecium sinecaudum TaxID=45286 RepID=A0A120K168_9SACH|nr:HBR166Cp [Eremothecium sinecaudum]AMD19067.1 HBR166Cp [Eremothecium sinecaudum]
MSSKVPKVRLPPLPRLKVKNPIIEKEANKCLVLMSNLLQCWSSNGHMNPACDELVTQLKACSSDKAAYTNKSPRKNTINYHAARLYPRISGKPHD